MSTDHHYSIYRDVIARVLSDSERLPSLPSITLKIRKAITQSSTTVETLAQLITKDPALCALLLKTASSPIYHRKVAPKTVSEVISMLGFDATNNLVMLHSVRSLFVMSSPMAKKLFALTWKRLVVKISVAHFLAKKINRTLIDAAQMAMMLSEVGSLSVLSAIVELPKLPDEETYYQICRSYSSSLAIILLKKWNIDGDMIDVIKRCGQWQTSIDEGIGLLDIANLSLYYTVCLTTTNPNLPKLSDLIAFQKLAPPLKICSQENWMSLVYNNRKEIQDIINSFR